MQEEIYLRIFVTPSDLGPNLKRIMLLKINEKYLNKEIEGTMITNMKTKDLNIIPLSRTTTNNIEIPIPKINL